MAQSAGQLTSLSSSSQRPSPHEGTHDSPQAFPTSETQNSSHLLLQQNGSALQTAAAQALQRESRPSPATHTLCEQRKHAPQSSGQLSQVSVAPQAPSPQVQAQSSSQWPQSSKDSQKPLPQKSGQAQSDWQVRQFSPNSQVPLPQLGKCPSTPSGRPSSEASLMVAASTLASATPSGRASTGRRSTHTPSTVQTMPSLHGTWSEHSTVEYAPQAANPTQTRSRTQRIRLSS